MTFTPFGFNASASKSTTTQDKSSTSQLNSLSTGARNQTSVRMPEIPTWLSGLTQGVAGQIGGLLNYNPADAVAPSNAFHGQAAQSVSGLGAPTWNYDGAADVTRGIASSNWLDNYMQAPSGRVQSASVLDNLESYMSPYTKSVVDSALADFDYGAGQTRAQQDLDLAGSGAFGGSGAALTRSMTEDALTRGRATTSSNLWDQAFSRGAALSNEDANRRQQASLQNAQLAQQDWNQRVSQYTAGQEQRLRAADQLMNLGSVYQADQRANATAQLGMAETMRGIEQAQRQAPLATTQQIVAMLSGLPSNLFVGETKQENETETKTVAQTESSQEHSKTKEKGFNVGAGRTPAQA